MNMWNKEEQLQWHSPTGYCKYCGAWVGYTPKSKCPEYGNEQYETTSFNKKKEDVHEQPRNHNGD